MKSSYWMFIVLSLVSLGLGIKHFFDETAIWAKYETATATLVDWKVDMGGNGGNMCPVYEFKTKEGDTRSYTDNSCANVPDPTSVGKWQQQIYYDPANPYAPVEDWKSFDYPRTSLIIGFVGFAFFSLMWMIPLFFNMFNKRR